MFTGPFAIHTLDFLVTTLYSVSVTVLSLVLHLQLGVSMIIMSPGIQWVRHISPTRK